MTAPPSLKRPKIPEGLDLKTGVLVRKKLSVVLELTNPLSYLVYCRGRAVLRDGFRACSVALADDAEDDGGLSYSRSPGSLHIKSKCCFVWRP